VILGGVLTASLGWRSVFFINVPIGIVAALLTPRFITESRGDVTNRQLDLPGAVTVNGGLALLVYGLTEAAGSGLASPETLLPLALAVAVLGSFLLIESRSRSPLMPLSFLRRGTVFTANSIAIVTVATISGMIFLLTIYLQQIRGYSALSAGIAFLPTALVFLIVGWYLSAGFVTRFGMKYVLVSSMAVLALGFVLLSRITPGASYLYFVLPSMLVASLGAAFAFTAFNIAALSGAKHGEEGLASGLVNTSSQVGGPIGLAVAVTIASTFAGTIAAGIGGETGAQASVTGFGYAFLGSAFLAVVGLGFAASLRLPRDVGAAPPARQDETAGARATPQAPGPHLSVKAPEGSLELGIRRVLVAVDGSENEDRAAQTAIKMAKDYRAELIILRVITVPTALTPAVQRAGTSSILEAFYEYAVKDATDYVDNLAEEAEGSGSLVRKGRGSEGTLVSGDGDS
jgi:Major Facilitator Superfamily/Universal stress protein family